MCEEYLKHPEHSANLQKTKELAAKVTPLDSPFRDFQVFEDPETKTKYLRGYLDSTGPSVYDPTGAIATTEIWWEITKPAYSYALIGKEN